MRFLPIALALFVSLAGVLGAVDTADTRMLSQPAVSAEHVAFIYAEDLWIAELDGSGVRRLTSHQGVESAPRFSPDGSLIAFSAQYDGNTDVFVLPIVGGVPQRLTWHPAADLVQGFSPDGSEILFTSARHSWAVRHRQLFSLPVKGGHPTQLPLPHVSAATWSPDGKFLAYRPHWTAFDQWKRYRGGTAARIVLYDTRDHSVRQLPWPEGRANDTDAMWVDERIYFRSDRDGEFNLYSWDPASGEIERLTDHRDFPILSATAGGGRIAYEQAGYLHLYDLASGRSRRLRIGVTADLVETRPRYVNGGESIRYATPSPSAARAVFESRGEIVTVPAKKGHPRILTDTPGAHERHPIWSPDGRRIAWFSDQSGEYRLQVSDQAGKSAVESFDLEGAGYYRDMAWAPDGKKIAYSDNSHSIYWIDLESGSTRRIGGDAVYGPIPQLSYAWSPDSRWIAYSANSPTQLHRIWIYSLEDGRSRPVTDGLSDAVEPAWDATGDHLFFLASTDAGPVQQWFAQSNNDMTMTRAIYLTVLRKGVASPLAGESDEEQPEDEEEAVEESEDDSAVDGETGADESSEEVDPVEIDFDGIDQRIVGLPIAAGPIHSLRAGAAGEVFYLHAGAGENPFSNGRGQELRRFDLEQREDESVGGDVVDYALTPDGGKLLYTDGDGWYLSDSGAIEPGEGALATSAIQLRIEPRAEWEQIYHEAWRINRDYFYDPGMHGSDWPAMREKYAIFLPHLAVRSDLNRLIQWLCSELGVGHHGVGGGDRLHETEDIPGGLLGVDYEIADGRFRFARVFGGLNWNPELRSPATEPGVDIVPGEYLLAVEGEDLYAPENLYRRFENTADRLVEITVGPNPDGTSSRNVLVTPVASELALRRRAWVEGNLGRVHEATDGRVAYVYVPNTAGQGHTYFKRYFFPQSDRQAIIVDDRHNSGGQIADYYINLLRRPAMANWAMRYGADLATPVGAIHGPKVMLIDENAASGGDLLPWMFRKAGLGPLIGRRTWGGLVGVLGFPVLMDGGRVTAPNIGIWTEDGFVVENEGVPPDIDVELLPADAVAGRDTQLEKAIEVILEMLEKTPPVEPVRPPFPIRGNN
jgi:tricorn protease